MSSQIWKKVMKVSLDDLENDPAKGDQFFDLLAEFQAEDESDPERLRQLFAVTQRLMLVKESEAQLAAKEMESTAADDSKKIIKKEQEIEDLKRQVANLERETRNMKRRSGDGEGGATNTRFLRDELTELEMQVDKLQKELKDTERKLLEEKRSNEMLLEDKDRVERDLREVRRQNDSLSEEIRDLGRQMDAQRETMVARRDDQDDVRDKIKAKNKLLSEALDANRDLVETNLQLEDDVDRLKGELRDGMEEINKTKDEYLKLKSIVDKSDKVHEQLRRENEMLKDQNEQLVSQVKSRSEHDDNIMVQLNQKVDEWQAILQEKDGRIAHLQQIIAEQREVMGRQDMDSEKTSIAALTKALEERDEKIDTLTRKLAEAVGDMEENVELMQNVKGELGKTSRGDRQHQKISQLQGTLRVHEGNLKDAETRATQAEDDARQKDKALNEALERIQKLEAGEYGLPEAVAEIKEHKMQINIRDRTIEELTQNMNGCMAELDELRDENDNYRERLGIDPKEPPNIEELKKRKNVRQQEDRALNRILQKEIEDLEEERTELKLTIRRLASATGQRAVALGLNADDLVAVDSFIGDLKEKNRASTSAMSIKSKSEAEELKIRHKQAEKEVQKSERKLENIGSENAELKAKNKELVGENKDLEKGMREIQQAIKEQSGVGGEPLQCPTLDRMLAAIDAKSLTGRYDASLYLKAQVDNLTGHNEELRKELRETRFEATRAHVNMEKAQTKATNLEAEVKQLKEVGAGGYFQTMPLPEGIALTSADIINNLNEHLVHALQEVHLKEEMIKKMESSLENYRRKFAVMRHQQGLLYQDYIKDKETWETSEKKLQEEVKEVQGQRQEDQARLQEFERLVDTLAQDEPEVRRRLAEMTRTVTVLRVNEAALTRRYTALADSEAAARKHNARLAKEAIAMQTAVAHRLGYLQRHKDMATFQMASLQRALDESVPARELDDMTRQFTALTEKYRDMLEKSNTLVARSEENTGYEIESKRLQQENNELIKELGIEKEKLHTLEAAFEVMRKQGKATSEQLRDRDVLSLSAKVTTLEMKELNERQRANHAVSMYDQQKIQLRKLEDRNFELESKFAELTRSCLEQQKVERQLRDELADCVTKEVSDADRNKISVLEKAEHELRMEVSRLKEVSDVASMQVRAYDQQQTAREKELTSLRQQLLDFQAQSDDKTVIGKLHRHIVQLQVSEGEALRQLEDAKARISHLEVMQLRTEKRLDDKDQAIYHNRLESRSKTRHLKATIQDLRKKYAGAVPLPQQEKFSKQMLNLQNDKQKIEDELKQTNADREVVEGRLEELKVQHEGLQELIATLKDGHGAQKVLEWQAKMETVRLEDLRLKRDVEKHKYQLKFQEGLIHRHEAEVLSLEEDKVRQAREFEQRELDWERREVDLERIIANMERAQAEIAGAASEFDQAVGALPDTNWPVPRQLQAAVQTIKSNVKTILDAKAEVAHYKKRMEEMSGELKEREKEVMKRDKLITEMRLRMPADAKRDEIIRQAQAATTTSAAPSGGQEDEDYEGNQAVRVALSTVASLQARVHAKEESVRKYQELLKQSRGDLELQSRRHEEELRMLHDKLHAKNDDAFHQFKKHIRDSMHRPSQSVPSNEQLRKLNEFEDIVADQDNSIAALRDKLERSRQEMNQWRSRHDDAVRAYDDDKQGLMEEHRSAVRRLEDKLSSTELRVQEKDSLLHVTQEELDRQKEANTRAPTTTMKNMIDRLKKEVALKEKQLKDLNVALSDLRTDMVSQAEAQVKAHADLKQDDINVQKLIDKHTKDLQERIEELTEQNSKLKKSAQKAREHSEGTGSEAEELRRDLSRRESQCRKLKDDKAKLEEEVDELEKKVQRMSTMAKQKTVTEPVMKEMEDLKAKNRRLQEELRKSKHQAEKPYEQAVVQAAPLSARDLSATETQVAKWEENKKWQKMVDRLKGRVKDKDEQVEKLTRSNEMLKNGLDRMTKEKEHVEGKLRTALRQGLESPVVARQASSLSAAAPTTQQVHSMQELKAKNHSLENQVSKLKRELAMGRDRSIEDVQMRNQFLTEKLQEMEAQLSQKALSASQEGSSTTAEFRNRANKEQALEKKVLQLSDENLQLRFELEAAKKDIPRLTERVNDQQKYIEILKNEKEQLKDLSSARSHSSLGSLGSLSSISSNIRRIGESGKSVKDLEKTIVLLKKVVDKTQAENKQLKKAPTAVLSEQYANLQLENTGLKAQLEELRQKVGASLSERYISQQEGTAKVMANHEKLRKDLLKEVEQNEKLRIQMKQQESRIRQLQQDLDGSRHGGGSETTLEKRSSTENVKEFRAMKAARAAEERAAVLEEELEKKSKMISDMTALLHKAAEREQQLLKENEALTEKATMLEQFPPGSKNIGDKQLLQEYQMLRLTVDRLENEKRELVHELQSLRKKSNPAVGGPSDVPTDEIVEKIASYDKIMREKVDLSTQLKAQTLAATKLKHQVDTLTAELANFGPEFFDEIEDLKFNYREAVERNVVYEEQLQQLSNQFGVSVDIPSK